VTTLKEDGKQEGVLLYTQLEEIKNLSTTFAQHEGPPSRIG
jgi:hypothetical protein